MQNLESVQNSDLGLQFYFLAKMIESGEESLICII